MLSTISVQDLVLVCRLCCKDLIFKTHNNQEQVKICQSGSKAMDQLKFFSKHRYIKKILNKRFGMEECKTVSASVIVGKVPIFLMIKLVNR